MEKFKENYVVSFYETVALAAELSGRIMNFLRRELSPRDSELSFLGFSEDLRLKVRLFHDLDRVIL